jgi:hypothetical protein
VTNLLKTAVLLLLASSLIACGTIDPQVVVKTEYVEKQIPIQFRPKGVNVHPVYFYTVNKENIDEFLERFEKENGDIVFFAISVPHYENLSLNLADLKRYIGQQNSLILYYEDSIAKQSDLPEDTEEVVSDGKFLGISIK